MSHVRAALLVAICLSISSFAAGQTQIRRDVVYDRIGGLGLLYDVLQPENQNGAAIIRIDSGGLESEWRPPESRLPFWQAALDSGYTVFVVYHRDAETGVDAIGDIHTAIRHIKRMADDFGVERDRIGVTGRSSGGMLALMAGLASIDSNAQSDDPLHQIDSGIAAVVAEAPPVDWPVFLDELREMGRSREEFRANAERMSPYRFVDEDDPPVLLIHGDQDEIVRIGHSYLMYRELQENEIASALVVVPGGPHRIDNNSIIDADGHDFLGPNATTLADARLAWFNRYLLDDD